MKKVSTTSVPALLETLADVPEDAAYVCQGQTAKLHSRNGIPQDGKQDRKTPKEFLMPPIPSARSSASSRNTSTPRSRDGFGVNPIAGRDSDKTEVEAGIRVVGETGYLGVNNRKKSTAEKLADTGYKLYTTDDSNKLPQILKPNRKISKGSKRKKAKISDEVANNCHHKLEAQKAEEEKTAPRDLEKEGEMEELLYNKYGLDIRKQFNMELTKPFTFSYFPKIQHRRNDNTNTKQKAKKLRKISTVNRKISAPISEHN